MAVADAPPQRRLSQLLLDIVEAAQDRVSLRHLADAVGDRGFAAVMILFAAPNLVPMPPGASTVFGIPLMLVSAQLLIGRPRVWLPEAIGNRSIDRQTFGSMVARLMPFLKRFEKVARPRLWPASREVADRWVGFVVFVMAVVLIFPIPLGNWLPGLAVVVVSLGLAERDGLWVATGSVAACLAIGVVTAVLFSAGALASWLVSWPFGN